MTVAAPTSCGKSALALFIALQAVKKDGHSCLIFSFEMPQKQLTKRMIQIMSGVNLRTVEERTASEVQVQRVKDIAKEIETLPIHTAHSVRGADDLFSQTRRYVNKKGVKLVVIDYLQLIPFNSNKMSKNDGIANISHRIKQMALELNIAVILLAQVNREGAKRGALDVYDLKDSGDIENDADVVLVMYPSGGDVESSKDKDYNGPYTNLIYKLAKNREGERGVEDFFKFYHCTGRFL
jgi:replicative DNA helicase